MKHLFLGTALALMLGHSLAGHSHAPKDANKLCQHEHPGNLLHFLQHLFEIDLGEEHLEFFAASQLEDVPLSAITQTAVSIHGTWAGCSGISSSKPILPGWSPAFPKRGPPLH